LKEEFKIEIEEKNLTSDRNLNMKEIKQFTFLGKINNNNIYIGNISGVKNLNSVYVTELIESSQFYKLDKILFIMDADYGDNNESGFTRMEKSITDIIKKIEDKGFSPSYNMSSSYLNPLHYIVIFFSHYERILLELKTGAKYDIYVYTFPYGGSGEIDAYKDIYNDNDFLKSFDELKEMIEEEQKKILFSQKVKNLSEKYNSPLEERYNYVLNKILDEEKLFISEKDNDFIINGDSEAIKDLDTFKNMNFEEIDFYLFYVNYLSKKEYEDKKVLVGYNGIDGKEVTMSKLKENMNEIRDSRSTFK